MKTAHQHIKVGLVGYGRLARHLAPALRHAGIKINQWCIRNTFYHPEVEKLYGVVPINAVTLFDESSDLIILMVPDKTIKAVAEEITLDDTIVCHTSGTTSVAVLPQNSAGIFYPLNTFNGKQTEWDHQTPFFIHAKNKHSIELLKRVATLLSNQVQIISEADLLIIHLAAVISQNFSNHLIAQAEEILISKGINREVIHPLLNTMMRNLTDSPAKDNQTGPATRHDENTISKQQLALESKPKLKAIYQLITDSIKSNLFE